MIKIFFSLLIFTAITSVLAQDSFNELGQIYQNATKPNPKMLINKAWSGRCFTRNNPTDPMAGGYILQEKRLSYGNGKTFYQALSYTNKAAEPDYFDDKSLDFILSKEAYQNTALEAVIRDDSIEINIMNELKSNLRMSGEYLIEELGEKNGAVINVRCYYFISEGPK